MQFLTIRAGATMSWLRNIVGSKNIDNVLNLNGLSTTPRIDTELKRKYETVLTSATLVDYARKSVLLGSVSGDSDVFEKVALMDENSWKYYSATGSFPDAIRMPEDVTLPPSPDVIGGTAEAITRRVFNQAMEYYNNNQPIDPVIFNTYQSSVEPGSPSIIVGSKSLAQWFNIPWGQITLYSSLADDSMDFPVYPEEYEDGVTATYDTMPDMLYQYEPWFLYKSSGPRNPSLTFKMHRDMWTGDHRDGKCNELIRFCEAQCYPKYNGAAVNSALSALYIAGKPYIRGIITEVKHTFSGPYGLDNFPLYVELVLTFNEVSDVPLTFDTVRRKGLIG